MKATESYSWMVLGIAAILLVFGIFMVCVWEYRSISTPSISDQIIIETDGPKMRKTKALIYEDLKEK